MKKYILLDWDGNLVKTLDVWLEACSQPLQKRGLHLSDEEIASCFGRPIERFAEWGIKDVDTAITEMDRAATELLPNAELYPDAVFVLEELKKAGKRLALITSSFHRHVSGTLDHYNMRDYFDVIVAHDDVKNLKPHPEPLEKALKQLGGAKEEAVMVGDTTHDIQAANNAGVDSILFYPKEHAKFYKIEDLRAHAPTHVVGDFRQILRIV